MPLQRQLIDVPIVGGVDQKTDPQLSTRPLQLSNCCYRKSGAIEKRYGSELVRSRSTADRLGFQSSYTTTGTPPTPLLLTQLGTTTARVGASLLHTMGTDESKWTQVDHVPSVSVSRRPVAMSGTRAGSVSLASDGTIVCHVWSQTGTRFGTGSCMASISDLATGQTLLAPFLLGTGRQVKVCYVSASATFIATWIDSATGDIKARACPVSTLVWGSASTILTDGIKLGGTLITAYDLDAVATGYAVGYEDSANILRIKTFTVAHALNTSTNTGFTLTPITAVALRWDSSQTRLWWVAIGVTGGVKRMQFGALNSSYAVSVANTTVEDTEDASPVVVNQTYQNVGIVPIDSASATIAYDTCVSSSIGGLSVVTVTTAASVGTITRINGGLSLMSRPWLIGTRVYFAATLSPRWAQGYPDSEHLIFEGPAESPSDLWRPVGRFAPSIGDYPFPFSHVSNVYATSSAAHVALPFAADTGGTGVTTTAIWSCRADLQTLPKRDAVELGGALYMTGGAVSVFDGVTVAEIGFFSAPEIESISRAAASGTLAAATYTYVCIWEGIDAAGRVHRSSPSVPVSIAASLNDRVDITVRCLSATTKQDANQSGTPFAVNLVVYRLQSGTYYRIDALGGTANVRTSYYQTLSDSGTYTAATILAQPTLYTSGGVLPHVSPPGCTVIAAHQSRIFTDSDDGTIWYSNPVAPGEVAAFTLDFRILPFEGGAVTGLVSLDDKLIIFKETGIYAIAGQGPNATGQGGEYSAPQAISMDLGCINPRSIVTCPLGIFFQSRDGITLLTRGLQVTSDIGARIETTLAAIPNVGAATHVADQSQVRFEVYSATDLARLVYDYHNDAWSTDTVYTPDSVDTYSPGYGAAIVGGVYTWLTKDGSLYRESLTTWLDSGTWVYMIATFSNIRAGVIDGMNRLWRIALNAYRYSSAGVVVGSKSWTAAEVDTIFAATSARIQLQEHVASQLREFTQVSFVDTPPSSLGTGRGFSLTGLTLEVGVRGSTSRRLASGARK